MNFKVDVSTPHNFYHPPHQQSRPIDDELVVAASLTSSVPSSRTHEATETPDKRQRW